MVKMIKKRRVAISKNYLTAKNKYIKMTLI